MFINNNVNLISPASVWVYRAYCGLLSQSNWISCLLSCCWWTMTMILIMMMMFLCLMFKHCFHQY